MIVSPDIYKAKTKQKQNKKIKQKKVVVENSKSLIKNACRHYSHKNLSDFFEFRKFTSYISP